MYAIKPFRRLDAVAYARRWALSRNPLFTDFAGSGGDCTNFVSQCVYAGSCQMNPTPVYGWFYYGKNDYAPAWTGVVYFYNFLTRNMEVGPFGHVLSQGQPVIPGDIIQLGRADGSFYHSLIVSSVREDEVYVCAHNNDALDRPLSSYTYEASRYLRIDGVRVEISGEECCFENVYEGKSIFRADGTEVSAEETAESAAPSGAKLTERASASVLARLDLPPDINAYS